MPEPLSAERLAEIRAVVQARTGRPTNRLAEDLLAEVDRLRVLTGVAVDPDYPDSLGGYCRNCSQWVPDRDNLIHFEDDNTVRTERGLAL